MPDEKQHVWRIVGDCHGRMGKLATLSEEVEYTICVGDVGFDYSFLRRYANPKKLKIVSGNHDNYDVMDCECLGRGCEKCHGRGYIFSKQSEHFLPDFGVHSVPGFGDVFFVRGAWSIDRQYRTEGRDWWALEEMPDARLKEALDAYSKAKPEFVVTHTAPTSIIPLIPFERLFGDTLYKTRTELTLQKMYDAHQPKTWVFGHFHVNWTKVLTHPDSKKNTEFCCLAECSHRDFPLSS